MLAWSVFCKLPLSKAEFHKENLGQLTVPSDLALTTNGVNNTPGVALERVGENYPDGAAFTYPETTNPVRLYLIDTAIGDPTSWTDANPKLKFEGTILVRGSGDPTVSTPRIHGTQLLSLVAGMDTGIAPGTPVHLLNYDIFPKETTTVSLLASAIQKAVQHSKATSTVKMRSAICIATSSINNGSSAILEDLIDFAIAEGIPVIVSAGNLNGQNASNYVPCAYGTKPGVICVGSANATDQILESSNIGVAVDLLAPGENVRTRGVSANSPFLDMTGTSPAASLVAGAVLSELSINGSLTPVQVESRIMANAKINTAGMAVLRTTAAATYTIDNPDGPIIYPSTPVLLSSSSDPTSPLPGGVSGDSNPASNPDSDADGIPDLLESFHGALTGQPPAPTISIASPGTVQFRFAISPELFRNATPFVLVNGSTWKIRCTPNFVTWDVPVGSLSKTTDAQGQVWLTASFPSNQPSCFVRLEVTSAP